MKCVQCGHENANDAKFCGNCGAARAGIVCNGCGCSNAPGSRFCNQCGRALETGTVREAVRVPEAERRQITVMFCDLVGSTALSQQLDPEDLRLVVRSYQEMAAEAITFFDGHLAQYLGDGLLVYFGYPRAHEDDARRAVAAGIRILAGLPALNERLSRRVSRLRRSPLQVRIGIHTGLVVAGEMGAGANREQLAIGETPNVAARVQGLAQPDTVLVSKNTYRLVHPFFEMVPLGPRTVKGVAEPIRVYEARGETETGRAEHAAMERSSYTPLVGREREIAMLLDLWEQAEHGSGRVALVSGEAGIGKSRLARALADHVASRAHALLEARFSPYHQHSPFHIVGDLLLQILGLGKDAAPAARRRGLEQLLNHHGVEVARGLPALGSLFGVGPDDLPTAVPVSPDEQRRSTLDALLRILVGMAAERPVLLMLEDMHWADASTVELIGLLVDQVPTARMFVLLTARPAFVPPWPSRTYATHLSLGPFTDAQTAVMVHHLTGGKTLPAEVLKQVIAKTDGVPLFAEELIKYVLESGLLRDTGEHYQLVGVLPAMAIPSTLQDSLMARLDRLAPLKSVVQLAATLGREFSYELLRAVSPFDDATLQRELAGLVEAELIYQHGLPPQATYMFKHALIQDAAYQALLKSTRQQYHQRIAEVLAERFPETVATQPEILAHHYTQAGLAGEAIDNWKLAGEHALKRSAYPEAIGHFSHALELVTDLPEGVQRLERELALQVAFVPALDATKGVSSPEVQIAYARAWELCQQLGDTPQLFPVLMGLRRFYFVRGELATARSVAEQLVNLASATSDPAQLIETHLAFGNTSLWQGEVSDALVHLEKGSAYLDANTFTRVASARLLQLIDPLVSCLANASWALWAAGSADQALVRSRQSVEYARRLEHPISMALALDFSAALREFRGEAQRALEFADEGIALCRNHGFTFWLGLLTVRRGWALSRIGRIAEGLAETQAGLAIWRQTRAGLGKPFLLTLLAETLMRAEMIDEARSALEEALAATLRGERFYEAEAHRLTGELLLRSGQPDEAEKSLKRALELASAQGARSMALRAATSLARHWSANGATPDAVALLGGLYSTFTESFDTPDLAQARDMLAELGGLAKNAPGAS